MSVEVTLKLNDKLSDALKRAEKNTESMDKALQHMSVTGNRAVDKFDKLERSVTRFFTSSTRAVGNLAKIAAGFIAIGGAALVMKAGTEFATTAIENFNSQYEAESKLQNVMSSRFGTSDIAPVMDLIAAQQELGIVGDETQAIGAAMLGTYMSNEEALKKLIPVMNDMAVAQNGYNVTAENIKGISQIFGKAMKGQYTALQRVVGILPESTKKVFETGNEMQRAAAISDLLGKAYGGMNEALGQTPKGQLIQFQNAVGDIYEIVGQMLMPALVKIVQILKGNLPAIQRGMLAVGFVMQKLLDASIAIYNVIANNWYEIISIISIIAMTVGAYYAALLLVNSGVLLVTGATKAWQAAQWLVNAAMMANAVGIFIAILALLAGILIFYGEWENQHKTTLGIIVSSITTVSAIVANVISYVINLLTSTIGNALNIVMDTFAFVVNGIARLIKAVTFLFTGNWEDALNEVIRFFGDFQRYVMDILISITSWVEDAINPILEFTGQGTINMTGTLKEWKTDAQNDIIRRTGGKQGYEDTQLINPDDYRIDPSKWKIDMINLDDAAGYGFDWGNKTAVDLKGKVDEITGMFGKAEKMLFPSQGGKGIPGNDILTDAAVQTSKNTGKTAKNTAKQGEQYAKSLQELARMQTIINNSGFFPSFAIKARINRGEIDKKQVIREVVTGLTDAMNHDLVTA